MDLFNLSDDVVLCDSAVFLPVSKTLVIADLQIGLEGQLRDVGQNIWFAQTEKMLQKLDELISQTGAKHLVINGDLKHEFGKITAQERYDVTRLLVSLKNRVAISLVKGNHDTLTAPLASDVGLVLQDFVIQDGVLIIHGHMLPDEKVLSSVHMIIIGHMHPAIRLSDGIRSERYKCFLVGAYKKKRLVVLPSFSGVVEGSDVLTVTPNSPLLSVKSLALCEVYVVEDEIRGFGTLQRISHMNG